MILLRRNSTFDRHFSVHPEYIKEGDVVKMVGLDNENSSANYPANVTIALPKSNKSSRLNPFVANLDCFDYIKEKDRG